MDARADICALIRNLTMSGRAILEPLHLDHLLRLCKAAPESGVQCAFEQLNAALREPHSQIRLSTVQVMSELFMRSHLFRTLLVADLNDFVRLTIGLADDDEPLPAPARHAADLRRTALEALHRWHGKFRERFNALAVAYSVLEHKCRVDFATFSAANSAALRDREAAAAAALQQHATVLASTLADVSDFSVDMEAALGQLSAMLAMLVPDERRDDSGGNGDKSSRAVAVAAVTEPVSAENREALLQEMALNSRNYELTVELAEDTMDMAETEDNVDLLQTVKEQNRLVTKSYLPRISRWLKALQSCEADGATALLQRVLELRERMVGVQRQAAFFSATGSSLGGRDIANGERADDDDDDDDDDDAPLEDVVEKDGYEQDVVAPPPRPRPRRVIPARAASSAPPVVTVQKRRVAEPATASAAPAPAPTPAPAPAKKPLKVPVVRWGPDLEYWGREDELVQVPRLMTSVHRFWQPSDDAEDSLVPARMIPGLTTRNIRIQPSFTPITHYCHAPLPRPDADGRLRLCRRQDREECPLHGRIIPRDPATGSPLVPTDRDQASDQVSAGESPEPKPKRRRSKLPEGSQLIDLKATADTVQARILARTKNSKHLRSGLDPVLLKKRREQFEGTWISPKPSARKAPEGVNVTLAHAPEAGTGDFGELIFHAHHVLFSAPALKLEIAFALIHSLERQPATGAGTWVCLRLKNFRWWWLLFKREDHCTESIAALEACAMPAACVDHAAFAYQPRFPVPEEHAKGWELFNEGADFARILAGNKKWRVSDVNVNFEVCASYPRLVAVPADVDDALLHDVAKFRHFGRFPVLAFCDPTTGAVLLRSSQPLTITSTRCYEDERLLRSVLQASTPVAAKGYIIDLRTQAEATSFRGKGGGSEVADHYFNWTLIYAKMGKVRPLEESLAKFLEGIQSNDTSLGSFLSTVDASHWMEHIRCAISTAVVVSRILHRENLPVLIHGSSGWDLEAIISSLTQLMIEPHCRTFLGFAQLVEKDWLRMGHPFAEMGGLHCDYSFKSGFRCPIFLLFLDTVWQIQQQYPCAFEFNEQFLITLFDHSQTSEFGTFLCNNQRDREGFHLKEKTISVWAFLAQPSERQKHTNALYERVEGWIRPSFRAQSLSVWLSLYGRWTHNLEPYEEAKTLVTYMSARDQLLTAEVGVQTAALAALEAEVAAMQALVDKERASLLAFDPAASSPAIDPLLGTLVS